MALEAMAINYKINSFLVSAIIETTNGQTLSKQKEKKEAEPRDMTYACKIFKDIKSSKKLYASGRTRDARIIILK